MTERERFVACYNFEPVDHVPDHEFGYWNETFPTWHAQGLPTWVRDNWRGDVYFRFERMGGISAHVGLQPGFEPIVLDETPTYRLERDGDGVTKKVFTDGTDSIPQFVDHILKTEADWEEHFVPRLQPVNRTKSYAPEEIARLNAADYPIGIGIGSLYGWIRNWMGLEGVSIAIGTEPAFVDRMMRDLCELTCAVIEEVSADIRLDYASMWEDMSANHGPLISPRMFRAFMTPKLKRITDLLRARGCNVVIVDSDGRIDPIIEPWLEGGVNCMFPLEQAGTSHPAALRAQYGRRLLMKGGVNKHALRAGPAAIDAALESLVPVVAAGGYIPTVDHRVPPDVTYENYLYYLKRKREVFGIPDPGVETEPR